MQAQLQTMANAYVKGDTFGFSRAAHQLRDGLRQLSPKIYPEESQLRLEYFYNHWDGFYRAALCYGAALLFSRSLIFAAPAINLAQIRVDKYRLERQPNAATSRSLASSSPSPASSFTPAESRCAA